MKNLLLDMYGKEISISSTVLNSVIEAMTAAQLYLTLFLPVTLLVLLHVLGLVIVLVLYCRQRQQQNGFVPVQDSQPPGDCEHAVQESGEQDQASSRLVTRRLR